VRKSRVYRILSTFKSLAFALCDLEMRSDLKISYKKGLYIGLRFEKTSETFEKQNRVYSLRSSITSLSGVLLLLLLLFF